MLRDSGQVQNAIYFSLIQMCDLLVHLGLPPHKWSSRLSLRRGLVILR